MHNTPPSLTSENTDATVNGQSAPPSGASPLKFGAYDFAFFVLIAGLGALTLASVVTPHANTALHSNTLSVAITTAALLVALGASYFALGEFLLYGRITSFYVYLAFVVFAAAEVGLGLHPLLASEHYSQAPYGWAVLRIAGGILLVAASMQLEGTIQAYRRMRISVTGLLVALGIAFLVSAWIYAGGPAPVSSAVQADLQFAAALLFGLASLLFWRAAKVLDRPWFIWLSMSLCIATFSEIQYALHQPLLTVVETGDALWLVFFTGILLALASEWSRDYRDLRWQARELGALHALMRTPIVESVAALEEHIVRIVSETFGADARLVLVEREAPGTDDAESTAARPGGTALPVQDRIRPLVGIDGQTEAQVALGVPLGSGSQHLGVLVVAGTPGIEFTTHDVNLLRAFGAQAAVLIDRSFLYEEVAAGAVLQERSRLAREIHDGLAQHLAFLKMRVAWLKRSSGSISAEQLGDIEGVLETALIEARHAITTLRAQPTGASTVDAIRDYAGEFGQVAGLHVEVITEEGLPELRPKVRVELLRVVQEALNNVRKHARANSVRLTLARRDDGFEVTIEDNGAGFDASQSLEGHFGLEIMRERAESVGGLFYVDSQTGRGTTISIWMPCSEVERRVYGMLS